MRHLQWKLGKSLCEIYRPEMAYSEADCDCPRCLAHGAGHLAQRSITPCERCGGRITHWVPCTEKRFLSDLTREQQEEVERIALEIYVIHKQQSSFVIDWNGLPEDEKRGWIEVALQRVWNP